MGRGENQVITIKIQRELQHYLTVLEISQGIIDQWLSLGLDVTTKYFKYIVHTSSLTHTETRLDQGTAIFGLINVMC